jgi:hypothetical protein
MKRFSLIAAAALAVASMFSAPTRADTEHTGPPGASPQGLIMENVMKQFTDNEGNAVCVADGSIQAVDGDPKGQTCRVRLCNGHAYTVAGNVASVGAAVFNTTPPDPTPPVAKKKAAK